MERYRYIIAVFTHQANRRQADAVRKSWGAHLPPSARLLFVYGNADKATLTGDELHLPCPDSYAQLPAKVLAAMRYIHDNFEFDYLIKTDDDTFLRPEIVLAPDHTADYIGFFQEEKILPRWHYAKVPAELQQPYQGDVLYPFARGMFYLLSARAVQIVATTDDSAINELQLPIGYEDVMIGNILGGKTQLERLDLETASIGQYIWHPVPARTMIRRAHQSWSGRTSLRNYLKKHHSFLFHWWCKLSGKWQRLMTDLTTNQGRFLRLKLRSLWRSDLKVYTRAKAPVFAYRQPEAVIAERHHFAYFPVPGAGQQEIEAALAMLLNLPHSKTHLDKTGFSMAQVGSPTALGSYLSWTCVRNPWDRLLAAFDTSKTSHDRFADFVADCCNTPDKQASAGCRSQLALLSDANDRICPQIILKYEELPDVLSQLSHKHGWPEITVQSPAAPHPERMTPELAHKIGERYRQDIEMFGFEYLQNN